MRAILITFLLAASQVGLALSTEAGEPRAPNIVVILADDLGYGDLASYGQKIIQTPHLDRLASQGMRFTQFYAGSSVCAPSRSVLMTGIHNGRGRVRDNLPHGVHLMPEDRTVAEIIKEAGYRTGAFGKWGLGDPWEAGAPLKKGFDEFYGYTNHDHAHFYYPHFLWDNDKVVLLSGNRPGVDHFPRSPQYAPELITARALAFLESSRHDKRRFFLYVPTILPHFSEYPSQSPESHIVPSDAPYTPKDWPQVEKNYAAMVTIMDQHVGQILAKLDSLNLTNDTLVIFMSDNGPYDGSIHDTSFFRSAGPFRGTKRTLYEGGIRVPMIARWPGVIPPGSVSHTMSGGWDLLPTLAEATGQAVPEDIDGISLLPVLRGGTPRKAHDFLYWDYGHVRGNFEQAVRAADWKAVRYGLNGPVELYNLNSDPSESRNVAAQNPDVVKRMSGLLERAYVPSPDYPMK